MDCEPDLRCGICIPPRSEDHIINSIRELLIDRVKTMQMGENGIHRVMEKYTIDKVMNTYLDLWTSVSKN